jgi:hypothetical protein
MDTDRGVLEAVNLFSVSFVYVTNNAYWLRHICLSVVPFVRCVAPIRRNFVKFYIEDLDENLSRKSKFGYNRAKYQALYVKS